jgi:hypothetical protein
MAIESAGFIILAVLLSKTLNSYHPGATLGIRNVYKSFFIRVAIKRLVNTGETKEELCKIVSSSPNFRIRLRASKDIAAYIL